MWYSNTKWFNTPKKLMSQIRTLNLNCLYFSLIIKLFIGIIFWIDYSKSMNIILTIYVWIMSFPFKILKGKRNETILSLDEVTKIFLLIKN